MKIKNLLAIILVVCMLATLFAACNNKTDTPDPTGSSPTPSSTVTDEGDGDEEPTWDEITEINYWAIVPTTWDDEDVVYEAINAITEKEIGVHVNFTRLPMADYGTQLGLAIGNNEKVDICALSPMPTSSLITLYSQGALMDVTDLLQEHGQGIIEALGQDILSTGMVDGGQYTLPYHRILNSNAYIIFRKDVLDEAGVYDKMVNMKTWAEYEEVLAAVKEVSGSMYPMGGQADVVYNFITPAGNISDTYVYDNLGDTLNMVWTDQKGNVELMYAREDIISQFKMVADWVAKGLYWADSVISSEGLDPNIAAKVHASAFNSSEFGLEVVKSRNVGTEMYCHKLASGMVTTFSGRIWSVAIPVTCTEPEAAMRLLNLFYTHPELSNLFVRGIEGRHYVVEDGQATFLEGKDASTSGYYGGDYQVGSQFLVLPWMGQGSDFRARALEDLAAATRSIYNGLSVSTADIASTVSAISNVRSEYISQMMHGAYTDSLHAEFLSKLDSAGIDEYIGIYKSAVAEFLA